MGEVLLCENAGKNFEDCIIRFKALSIDKNSEVRKTFYAVMFRLITNFNTIYLKKYEHNLVIFLMNGLNDEKEDIIKNCFNFIEEAGIYRKKLAIEIDGEIDEN